MLALLWPITADAQRSGYDDASPSVRAMQDDDFANPGFLWVQRGGEIWERGCKACHGAAETSMRGVAARYPLFDVALGRPVTLEQRINGHQGGAVMPSESRDLLAITAFVGHQSKGMPMAVSGDGTAQPYLEMGRDFFFLRQGQLNLSCAQCHDDNKGQRLAGSLIPEGHPNGYPIYRLEWQSMGSLSRRLRNCLTGVRAELLEYGSPAQVALELYLGWRATGLKVETPGVRP
jgi:sulfur-oxidizing protein SoxA